MKKTYKIEVDCANCANKMEEAAKMTPGVKDAVVNFMALKTAKSSRMTAKFTSDYLFSIIVHREEPASGSRIVRRL